MRIAVIDLFCGMGGFSQGAIDAGAEVILSVDSWDYAVKVHIENHPDVKIIKMELGHPSHYRMFKRLVDEYRAKGYHVHIHGSPPCQALSNASRRDASEGMPLVLWFLDLVERCDPDSWSMENVLPVRKRLPEGTPSVVLNSADFGVAQTRRRCYAGEGWVAEPSHSKEEWLGVIDVLPHLNDLIGYAPPNSMKSHFKHKRIENPFPTVTSQSPRQLRLMMDSGRSSSKTSGINPRTGKKEGGSGPLFREVNQPSYTVMSSPRVLKVNTAGGGASNSRRVNSQDSLIELPSKTIHNNRPSLRTDEPQKIRSLTLPETLILQGFNPDYKLDSAKTQKNRWTMVGNAVPPPVAAAVIRGVQNAVFN